MQVHIWPSRIRPVTAANAAIRVHASWVASSLGIGTVWKWSNTQIEDQSSLASARRASPAITPQCCEGSIPTRSMRQPCGTNSPNFMNTPVVERGSCGSGVTTLGPPPAPCTTDRPLLPPRDAVGGVRSNR